MSVITEKVLDRFPNLVIGILESGVGWVPFWFERMDEHYETLPGLVPQLRRLPSDWALSSNLIFSCDPDKTLPSVLKWLGSDHVMYASDYPHWDAKTSNSVEIVATRYDLTEDEKRRVLSHNAARIYHLA